MKKLVILSAFLSPYRSGAEAMAEEVAVRLSDTFDITIVTGRYSRSLPVEDMLQGKVRVIRVGLGCRFDKWLYPFLAAMRLGSLHPDIVHAVLETFAGLALYFCRCNARKVLTLQTTNTTFLKKRILSHPDVITAISDDLKTIAAGMGRTDVTVIPNGIDLHGITQAASGTAKDSGRILFVGRLEPMKGVDVLLKAFAIAVKGQPPHVHLRIVGDGSQAEALRTLAEELDIGHRVTFTGRVQGDALFQEYAKAEIFCGLSRSEALGNVFLESQAAGCAVVATNVGGIPEVVHDGITGLLVPPEDPEAAAKAIRTMLSDTALRAKCSVQAQRHAKEYGWDGIAERYKKLLLSA